MNEIIAQVIYFRQKIFFASDHALLIFMAKMTLILIYSSNLFS